MYPEDILDEQDAEHLCAMGSMATKLAAAAHEAKGAKMLEESVLRGGKSRKSNASNDDDANNESTNRLRSGVYQFFKSPVLREDDDGRKYQFFECAAPKGCKHKAKGTTRYQTNKDGSKAGDRSSTGNLTKHATKCWGNDVVKGG
ncbi:hypothetical protein B0H14DRAFT_3540549 [Mycena olivaceomarginata]|nr:hypothetical protein B0H14DRAFT_3540549 [Mycena olivaceomarginata]